MVFCLVLHGWQLKYGPHCHHRPFYASHFFYLSIDALCIYSFTFTKSLVFCDQEHIHFVFHGLMMLNKMEWIFFLNMEWGKCKKEHLNAYFFLSFNVEKEVTHKGKNWGNKWSELWKMARLDKSQDCDGEKRIRKE